MPDVWEFKFPCTQCKAIMSVPRTKAGDMIPCPTCGTENRAIPTWLKPASLVIGLIVAILVAFEIIWTVSAMPV